jgi:hypothetical protein
VIDWVTILFILPMGPLVLLINGHIALWVANKFVDVEKGRVAAFSAVVGMGISGLKPVIESAENAAIGVSYLIGLVFLWHFWFKRKAVND